MQSGESHPHPDGTEHVGICPCIEGLKSFFCLDRWKRLPCLSGPKSDSKIFLPSPASSEKGAHSDRETGGFLRVLSSQNFTFQKA